MADFEITVGDRTVIGGPGTYLYGPRNIEHRWTNVGKGRGRLLNVFTPSGIEGYFVDVGYPGRLAVSTAACGHDSTECINGVSARKFWHHSNRYNKVPASRRSDCFRSSGRRQDSDVESARSRNWCAPISSEEDGI